MSDATEQLRLGEAPAKSPLPPPAKMRFNGSDYEPAKDDVRLSGQILRVFDLMRDGAWRTLAEVAESTGDPPASISAQLRHLRKRRFGEHVVEKRPRGDRERGLFEYRLVVNASTKATVQKKGPAS